MESRRLRRAWGFSTAEVIGRLAVIMLPAVLAACNASGGSDSPGGKAPLEGPLAVARTALAEAAVMDIQSRFTWPVDEPSTSGAPGAERRAPVLRASRVDAFELEHGLLTPRLPSSALAGVIHRARLSLPERSTGALRLEDQTSGMSIEVALERADDVPAEQAAGYLVYRGALQSALGGAADTGHVVHLATPDGVEDYVRIVARPEEPQVDYRVVLGRGVAGLRLVSNTLEFLDEVGVPRLRMAAPYLVDSSGRTHEVQTKVLGCAVDTDASPPYGRSTTPPGAAACGVRVAWAVADSGQTGAGRPLYPVLLDPGWATTGNMISTRLRPLSAVLSDGRVLVAGGLSSGTYLNTSEVFDPATGTWSSSGTMASRRVDGAMIGFGLKALVAGGRSASTTQVTTSEVWSAGVWGTSRTMVVGRTYHSLTWLGTTLTDKVIAAGGNNGTTTVSSVEAYDLSANTWTQAGVATLKAARQSHRTVALGSGRALISGGNGTSGSALATAERYELASSNTVPSQMSAPRADHVAIKLSTGKVLLALGGSSSVDLYDPTANSIAPDTHSVPGTPSTTWIGAAGHALKNRRAVVFGGYESPGSNYVSSTYAYAPGEDSSWSSVDSLNTPRNGFGSAPLSTNGDLLAFGGSDGSVALRSAEIFTLWANGSSTTSTQRCASGYRADGYCCNSACGGGCDVCNGTGTVGTCTKITGAGTPSCAPYYCTGATSNCPTTCTSNSGCDSASYCSSSQCVPKKANGSSCTAGSQCTSDNCVDGVCCNTSCTGSCDVCNAVGSTGTCTKLTDGTQVTGCKPYLCNGSSALCPSTCVATADCFPGFTCVAGKCQQQGQGTPCTTVADCGGAFAFCADGKCCDTACSGGCDRCNVAGFEGLCTLDPAGTPPTACGSPSQNYLCSGASGVCPTSCTSDSVCVSGYYCAAQQCLQKKAPGVSCGADNECSSSHCVDGVCCNTACSGACDICDKAGVMGTCSAAGAGTAGEPSCAPFKCGAADSCAITCATNVDCVGGYYCSGGDCAPQLGSGAPCLDTSECDSGLLCIDGVCCNDACSGECRSCLGVDKGDGVDGICGDIESGKDPGNECTAENPLTCGKTGWCGGAGKCELQPVQTPCGTLTSCANDAETKYECNGSGLCVPTQTTPCGDYTCAGAACATSCDNDSSCYASNYCDVSSHTCVPELGLGTPCSLHSQCSSGHCVDGICCDKVCGAQCFACSAAKKGAGDDGICEPVGNGAQDADDPCPLDPVSTCGRSGTCNGSGACGYYAAGTACKGTLSCVGNSAVGFVCNSFNECVEDTAGVSCEPYLCDAGTGCVSVCTLDSECIAEHYCDAGQCVPQKTAGQVCDKDTACKVGNCVDGICCTSACDGSCERCDIANGQGTVDGICRVVAAGLTPSGIHAPCAGTQGDTCAGACNGTSRDCEYPSSLVSCPGSSCEGNVAKPFGCNGGGTCVAQPDVQCGSYACDTAAGECKDSCLSTADCAAGSECNQATQVCAPVASSCIDDFTSQSAGGTKTSCAPYKCESGACRETCSSTADCAEGFECQGSKCIEKAGGTGGSAGAAGAPQGAAPPASGDDGGCAFAPRRPRSHGPALLLGALALFALARMRRRPAPSSSR